MRQQKKRTYTRSLRHYYFRFILRPIRTLKLSLLYLYGRFFLFLALKGIQLPGLEKIKNKLPQQALDVFERQILIYEIKGERFSFRKGPLWLRKTFEKILLVFEKNKFWFLIVLKSLLALIAIIIPIALFILVRGILPVPERVPFTSSSSILPNKSFLRTDWLYTESPFDKNKVTSEKNFNMIDPKQARGVSITPVLEPDVPAGLIHFGIGYYPSKLNLVRGFLASESSSLIINRQRNATIEVENGNRLRIQYYLFPSKDSSEYQCKIELRDQNNKIIVSTQQTTPNKNSLAAETGITKSWHVLFTPEIIPDSSKIKEFIINSKSPPQKITVNVSNGEKRNQEVTMASSNEMVKKFKSFYPNKELHDVTNDNCIFALGDFSFERVVVNPPKRRGIIFILVDTLRADTAYDKKIMPNFNQFADEKGVRFLEHRAQANMTVPSITALMTSRFARDIGSIAFTYAADTNLRKDFYATKTPLLATSLQNLGYRVGGIGWLSLFSEAMEGGVDLGFHNAIISESPSYEARQITEQMGSWLEMYGEAPFFLYLHYNTMHGPYKPPFTHIDLSKFFAKPFGLNQRKQLYDALGRYWDQEFINILQKLKDLGIYNNVDIIITADHGAQFFNQPWDNLSGVEQGISGGYADKGHSLLDEEVRVPLIIHLTDSKSLEGSQVSLPTAHVDLFPTIYNLAGGEEPDPNWRGLNLYPALENPQKRKIEHIVQKRNYIYFDAHQYAGILYWGDQFKNTPIKYIRQFNPDSVKLYLTHNPWNLNINWYQPETFAWVNLRDHTENWIPSLQGTNLENIRQSYYLNTPSEKILRLISKYTGTFSSTVSFKLNSEGKSPKVILFPDNIKATEKKTGDILTFILEGTIKEGEAIWINLGTTKLQNILFEKGITPLICQNGNLTRAESIPLIFENNVCPFFPPPDGIVEGNYFMNEKPVVIQKSLSNEQVQQIEGKGAGEALQNALREWGYAK